MGLYTHPPKLLQINPNEVNKKADNSDGDYHRLTFLFGFLGEKNSENSINYSLNLHKLFFVQQLLFTFVAVCVKHFLEQFL